jgi:hypothetical protein
MRWNFSLTTAHQLGLAVENLRLVGQILRSHRQWTNTFDSIHDPCYFTTRIFV